MRYIMSFICWTAMGSRTQIQRWGWTKQELLLRMTDAWAHASPSCGQKHWWRPSSNCVLEVARKWNFTNMSFRCEKEKMKMEAQRGDGEVRKQRLPGDSGLRPMSGLTDLSLEDSWEAPNMCDKITGAAKQRMHCDNMAMGVRRSCLGLSRISEKSLRAWTTILGSEKPEFEELAGTESYQGWWLRASFS